METVGAQCYPHFVRDAMGTLLFSWEGGYAAMCFMLLL